MREDEASIKQCPSHCQGFRGQYSRQSFKEKMERCQWISFASVASKLFLKFVNEWYQDWKMLCWKVQCDVMGLLGKGVQRVGWECSWQHFAWSEHANFIKARMKCRMNISWCSELWGWVEKCVLHALLERPAPRSDREQVTYKVMWMLLNLSEGQGSQHFCLINEARGLRKTQVCYSDVWLKMRHPQSDTWETAQYFVFEHKSGVRALSSK